MVRFTTCLKSLFVALACLMGGTTAQAQFSGGVTQYPTDDYSSSAIEFSLTAVATALETDAQTLASALSTYIDAETPDPILLYTVTGEGEVAWNADIEAANHGFWMNAQGIPVGYGENARFYASPDVDSANDVLVFNVGQMPNTMEADNVAEATLKLKFNEKAVTFSLRLSVIALPELNVPEPTLKWAELQIVGEQEIVVEQYPRGGYDADAVRVNIGEALSLLGITEKEALALNLSKVLYATQYNTADVEQGGGMKKDSLTNESTAGAPGWWMRPIQNEEGEETGEVSAAGWGDVDKFFIETFKYDAANDSLTCNLGQYPGSCKDNEEWFTYIYIIYGEKAYRLKYTLKVLEKTQGNGLADYTKVGENAVVVEQSPTDDYSTTGIQIDVETIANALGCEVSALGAVALDDKDNFAGSTANNGGWWLTSSGTVTSWGQGASFFIEPATNGDWSLLNVGQYPNTLSVGDEVSAKIYFINGINYYEYDITLKIIELQQIERNFESVATRSFTLQTLLDNSYTPMDLASVKTEDIETLLGTATPTLFGLNPDSVAAVTGTPYSNKYSCDPKPGFWLAKDGNVSVWGANSPVGICWVDNTTLRFFQYPNANAVGDVFKTKLFLVNEETDKMITLNIQLSFVESLVEKTIVGEENIKLPVSEDGADVEIDLTKAATALEVSVNDLLDSNNYYLRGMKEGIYGEGQNAENGLSFDLNGQYDGYGSIYFSIAKDGDKAVLSIGSNDAVADDWSASGQFCFEINDNQYVYYVKFLSQKAYTEGVADVKTDAKKGTVYDLQGRRVMNAQRGFYIVDGKKFVVK